MWYCTKKCPAKKPAPPNELFMRQAERSPEITSSIVSASESSCFANAIKTPDGAATRTTPAPRLFTQSLNRLFYRRYEIIRTQVTNNGYCSNETAILIGLTAGQPRFLPHSASRRRPSFQRQPFIPFIKRPIKVGVLMEQRGHGLSIVLHVHVEIE